VSKSEDRRSKAMTYGAGAGGASGSGGGGGASLHTLVGKCIDKVRLRYFLYCSVTVDSVYFDITVGELWQCVVQGCVASDLALLDFNCIL
jgi:hypothetical protein